ncbi:MAG TPA: alkaline phosphatase family protein [Thermoanaerobaculia bacterium]|nr:alkaline phosphatase family protein [Thermoanaerobaculia bacterium]
MIWVGLDGLDFELVDRLAAEGRMPHWKRLAAEGYTARLESFSPPLSPIVWTTIATGVAPDVHRVLDFQEIDPKSGLKVPISGYSRAVPAIWNVASAEGRSVGVVGWWATHPAEEVSGFFVSDHASPILFEGLPRTGVAYPAGLSAGVEQIAAREGVVSDAELARFLDVPLEEIARSRGAGLSNPVAALARLLGATRVQQRIARDLYDRNLPDLMMVYFEGTDVVGHAFAPFVPPRLPCVSESDFARYHRAVDEYYAEVDRLLGQWMRRADEDGATLVVNSDHGFKWGSDRSCDPSDLKNPSMSAAWHRLEGVFAVWGARVRRNPQRGAASVFDLAPTVAALLDLPVDRRVRGRVLREALPDLTVPPRRDLFDTLVVRRIQAEGLSEKEANEYARRLQSLGYLSGSEPAKLAPTGGERPGLTEVGWNNLGVYLRDNTKDFAAAEAAFQRAMALAAQYSTPQFNLAALYRSRGQDEKAIDWLFRSFAAGHAHAEDTILNWYVGFDDRGRPGSARKLLERGALAYPQHEPIARELGLVRYHAKDCAGAREAVARFEATTQSPETLNTLALIQVCLGRRVEAAALLRKSLALKADQPGVLQSLDLLEKGAPKARPAP